MGTLLNSNKTIQACWNTCDGCRGCGLKLKILTFYVGVWRRGLEVETLDVLCWGLAVWFEVEKLDVLC